MSDHQYVDIPPAVRRQAQALATQADAISRVLTNFLVRPDQMKSAKQALTALRKEALALSREL